MKFTKEEKSAILLEKFMEFVVSAEFSSKEVMEHLFDRLTGAAYEIKMEDKIDTMQAAFYMAASIYVKSLIKKE